VLGGEFVVDVATQSKTFAQHLTHCCGKEIWSGSGSRCVILGDQAAHRHARKLVEQRQDGLPNSTSDVFEININPIWTCSCELFSKVSRMVIDGCIEAKFFDNRAAFFCAAPSPAMKESALSRRAARASLT
jgi:hypothetical protein